MRISPSRQLALPCPVYFLNGTGLEIDKKKRDEAPVLPSLVVSKLGKNTVLIACGDQAPCELLVSNIFFLLLFTLINRCFTPIKTRTSDFS